MKKRLLQLAKRRDEILRELVEILSEEYKLRRKPSVNIRIHSPVAPHHYLDVDLHPMIGGDNSRN